VASPTAEFQYRTSCSNDCKLSTLLLLKLVKLCKNEAVIVVDLNWHIGIQKNGSSVWCANVYTEKWNEYKRTAGGWRQNAPDIPRFPLIHHKTILLLRNPNGTVRKSRGYIYMVYYKRYNTTLEHLYNWAIEPIQDGTINSSLGR